MSDAARLLNDFGMAMKHIATGILLAICVGATVHADTAMAQSSTHSPAWISGHGSTLRPDGRTIPLAWMGDGNPTFLIDTHEKWRVICAMENEIGRCAFSQVQTGGDGQRSLTIELAGPVGGLVSGIIVLPFGLDLDAGVMLDVEGQSTMQAERFRTCIPAGCIVPINLDKAMINALRSSRNLKVTAVTDSGEPTLYAIPLGGFGAALDQVAALDADP